MFDIQVLLHACTLVLLMQAQLGGAEEVQENAEDGICILHIMYTACTLLSMCVHALSYR